MKGLVEPGGRCISRRNNKNLSYWPFQCYLLNLALKPKASAQEVSGLHENVEGCFFFMHPSPFTEPPSGWRTCPPIHELETGYSIAFLQGGPCARSVVSVASTSLAFRVCLSFQWYLAAYWTWQQHKARSFPPAKDSHHLSGRAPH